MNLDSHVSQQIPTSTVVSQRIPNSMIVYPDRHQLDSRLSQQIPTSTVVYRKRYQCEQLFIPKIPTYTGDFGTVTPDGYQIHTGLYLVYKYMSLPVFRPPINRAIHVTSGFV